MSKTAISIRGLGKRYTLGETLSHSVLRDRIADGAKALVRGFRGGPRPNEREKQSSEFWALRDVSFEVGEGEVVGIIGRNGAGKSTLLKVLSQITEPTEGEIHVRGRVASLLEVGTGFHPELTGRENVFLNGAILGMTRAEIKQRFDEIVAFAEIERFIDTPVKRYSSGMYVRLAFAVAAHLEPEILLVDEVLAVGDAGFRKKCLGKMSGVARSGRTILFVSHNMAAVESLCSRTVLLESGRLTAMDESSAVISRYLGAAADTAAEVDLASHGGRRPGAAPLMHTLRYKDASGRAVSHVPVGEAVCLEIEGVAPRRLVNVTVAIRINKLTGERVATCHSGYQHPEPLVLEGRFRLTCRLDNCRLMPGPYSLILIVKSAEELVDQVEDLGFTVSPRDVYGTGRVLPERTGTYIPEATWSVTPL